MPWRRDDFLAGRQERYLYAPRPAVVDELPRCRFGHDACLRGSSSRRYTAFHFLQAQHFAADRFRSNYFLMMHHLPMMLPRQISP